MIYFWNPFEQMETACVEVVTSQRITLTHLEIQLLFFLPKIKLLILVLLVPIPNLVKALVGVKTLVVPSVCQLRLHLSWPVSLSFLKCQVYFKIGQLHCPSVNVGRRSKGTLSPSMRPFTLLLLSLAFSKNLERSPSVLDMLSKPKER